MELVVLEPGKVMQETARPVFCVLGIGNGNIRVKMVVLQMKEREEDEWKEFLHDYRDQ